MRLICFDDGGSPRHAVLLDDGAVPLDVLAETAEDAILGILSRGAAGLAALGRAAETAPRPARLPLSTLRLLPPVPRPGKIVCIGLNYAAHAREGGNPIPDFPSVFLRCTTSLTAPGADLAVPMVSDQLDYEAELAIVIGAPARCVTEAEALQHVAGYTIFNDGSVRDYQRKGSQWTMGKNFDRTGGLGPVLVSADALPAGADGLRIQCRLNGATMQDSTTADMIFSVAKLVSLLSEAMTLEPGDVIATGTPSGVGYARTPPVFLRPGDVCEIEIEGIGILCNGVAAAPAR